jgi:ribosomal protein L37AE/L43A
MAEFENPYAKHDPFIRAEVDCEECGGKLWEYALQGVMVCEDCRTVFATEDVRAAIAEPA